MKHCFYKSHAGHDVSGKFARHSSIIRRARRGIVMIWVAIFLSLMVLLVGLSLDAAKVMYVNHQLQNAADAAALAGAQMIKLQPQTAMEQAIETAAANFADKTPVLLRDNPDNDPALDVVLGIYYPQNRQFVPSVMGCNAIKVVARRNADVPDGPVTLNFGPIAGVDAVDIAREAIAISRGGTGAGLIALDTDGIGLELSGTVSLAVGDGEIQVNSYEDGGLPYPAFDVDGTSWTIEAQGINVCGFPDQNFDWEDLPIPVTPEAPFIPDPLCPYGPQDDKCLPAPIWNPASDLSPIDSKGEHVTTVITGTEPGQPAVFFPGYYSGGFDITGGDVVFEPGIYILGGGPKQQKAGLLVSGNANLWAQGVMFYFPPEDPTIPVEPGRLDLSGTGSTVITPAMSEEDFAEVPQCPYGPVPYVYPSGDSQYMTYEDISFFQDRDNDLEARIIGTSGLDIGGTLYFPSNHVELGGDGSSAGNQLIAGSVDVHGTGTWQVNYDGRNKAPGFYSNLVE